MILLSLFGRQGGELRPTEATYGEVNEGRVKKKKIIEIALRFIVLTMSTF
jgi:hypothetical protein